MPPSLESLALEITLNIIRFITDLETLRSLVHASPVFHEAYTIAHDEIYTRVTLAELRAREVDVLTPVDFAEVYIRGEPEWKYRIKDALEKLYRQSASVLPVKLRVDECMDLLKLGDLKGYRRNEEVPYTARAHTHFPSEQQHFECTISDRLTYRFGTWRDYQRVDFGSPDPDACKAISKQLGQAHSENARNVRNKQLRLAADAAAIAKLEADYLKLHPPVQESLSLSAISSVEIAPATDLRASSSSKSALDV